MDDLMLERLLERSAASTAYPPTPPLRGRVLASIAAPASVRASRRPAFVLVALALVALALTITLVVPSSRSAVAQFFGIEGSKIERLPTPAGGVVPTPLPTPEEIDTFAHPSTIADAAGAIGFTPALVPGESSPEACIARYASDAVVILRYRSFDLWEMRARGIFFGKSLPEGVVVLDTAVNGNLARWIEGGPHIARVFDENGVIPGSERTVARDTLIWRTGFALYRLETTLPMTDALRVAEALP